MQSLLKWLGYDEPPRDNCQTIVANKENAEAHAKLHRALDRQGVAGLAEVDRMLAGVQDHGNSTRTAS